MLLTPGVVLTGTHISTIANGSWKQLLTLGMNVTTPVVGGRIRREKGLGRGEARKSIVFVSSPELVAPG